MSRLLVECPACGEPLELDGGFAGGVCRCAECGTLMKVPHGSGRASHTSDPDEQPTRPGPPLRRPASPLAAQSDASGAEVEAEFEPADEPGEGEEPGEASGEDETYELATPPTDAPPKPEPSPPEARTEAEAAETAPASDASESQSESGRMPQPRDPNEAPDRTKRHGRLQHYLRALTRHYRKRTPEDLTPQNLPVHGQYLEHRHHGIARRVLRLLDPETSRHRHAQHIARRSTPWRDTFHSACQSREAIVKEMHECAEYWSWVVRHGRLPSRLAVRLVRYNTRPIAHPWAIANASILECLGQIDAELDARTKKDEGESDNGEFDEDDD